MAVFSTNAQFPISRLHIETVIKSSILSLMNTTNVAARRLLSLVCHLAKEFEKESNLQYIPTLLEFRTLLRHLYIFGERENINFTVSRQRQ